MKTYHIHIQGQVQGVGFRPFVYQLAQKFGLTGQVSNRSDGVSIDINATESTSQLFLKAILNEHPKVAQITEYSIQEVPSLPFSTFSIVHSQRTEQTNVLLTPDMGLCSDCRAELLQKESRRYEYAFTNCTYCGPRYSIIQELPYDRDRTAMAPFSLCSHCQEEYNDPTDRRYYAQANTCSKCPITLSLYDYHNALISNDQTLVLSFVAEKIQAGAVIAIKGVGGYLLVCDATNPDVVSTLRARKHRPAKPFAVMYPGLSQLIEDTPLDGETQELLTGTVAPIVLLPLTDQVRQRVAYEEIAPNLSQLGVMLPYVPLFEVLMRKIERPVVATSANISGSPVIFRDEDAEKQLASLVDFRLTYDREIMVPQDDSVVKFTSHKRQQIILRRSRGIAPTFLPPEPLHWKKNLLAMGGDLKSTFAYTHAGNQYVSQYLGDMTSFDTQENYRRVLEHFLKMFNSQPEVILADQHPQYFSTQLGQQLSKKYRTPVHYVQHHQAHFAALLGEHGLISSEEPILGVVWDGTGLGEGGQIWGGEFFVYHQHSFKRIDHLSYFPHLIGDKMAREPRLSALSLAYAIPALRVIIRQKFTEAEWKHYTQKIDQPENLITSSVGRLFDGVASLLGLIDRATYEGEAALQLETVASRYLQQCGYDRVRSYFHEKGGIDSFSTQPLISGISEDISRESTGLIAARFHFSLAHYIRLVAQRTGLKKIAMSGGVFQNGLLIDMICRQMEKGITLYFHEQLSPNDENISFGQLVHYLIQQKAQTISTRQSKAIAAL